MDSFVFRREYYEEAKAQFPNKEECCQYLYILCSMVFDGGNPYSSEVPKQYRALLAKTLALIRADQERYLKRKAKQNG